MVGLRVEHDDFDTTEDEDDLALIEREKAILGILDGTDVSDGLAILAGLITGICGAHPHETALQVFDVVVGSARDELVETIKRRMN